MAKIIEFNVPILWLDKAGARVDRNDVHAGPFVIAEFAARAEGEEDRWFRTLALIDTGSTYSLVVPEIISSLGAIKGSDRLASGAWSNTDTQPSFSMCMRFPQAPSVVTQIDAGQLNVPIGLTSATSVLGLDALRPFRLVLGRYPDPSFLALRQPT